MWRPISSTSSKPLVVTSAQSGKRRSSTALVAMVVPCTTSLTAESGGPRAAAAPAMPSISPTEGSAGVVGTLNSLRRPSRSSSTCTSVNVPPMSIAARMVLNGTLFEPAPFLHDATHARERTDIAADIALHHDQVGATAGSEHAPVF